MSGVDKRRHPRFDSLNLSYICLDEQGAHVLKSMGRTTNVSRSGIRLETHFAVDLKHTLLLTIALDEDLVEVRCRIIHCRAADGGMFETGLEFLELGKREAAVLDRFIDYFQTEPAPLDQDVLPEAEKV